MVNLFTAEEAQTATLNAITDGDLGAAAKAIEKAAKKGAYEIYLNKCVKAVQATLIENGYYVVETKQGVLVSWKPAAKAEEVAEDEKKEEAPTDEQQEEIQ